VRTRILDIGNGCNQAVEGELYGFKELERSGSLAEIDGSFEVSLSCNKRIFTRGRLPCLMILQIKSCNDCFFHPDPQILNSKHHYDIGDKK